MDDVDYREINRLKQIIIVNCPKCHGYGTPCPCQEEFAFEVKKIFANIPPKYRNFSMSMINSPQVQKTKQQVQNYVNQLKESREDGQGVYLWSTAKGTAKTAFASIILLEALKKGHTAYFTDLDACIAAIMRGWYDEDREHEFKKKVLHSDFLVIDDIGGMEIKTRGNLDLISTALTTTFRHRANALLPTILTSNLSLNEIDREFGERLQSIMHEHLQIIECQGEDYRRVIAQLPKRSKNE